MPGFRYGLEVPARLLLEVLVETVTVRIHRHDSRKISDGQVPHCFRGAEFHERHTIDADDRAYREREAASASGGAEPESKREKRKGGGDKPGKVAAHRAGKKRK